MAVFIIICHILVVFGLASLGWHSVFGWDGVLIWMGFVALAQNCLSILTEKPREKNEE